MENEKLEYILRDSENNENLELVKERYAKSDLKNIRILKINGTNFVYDRRKITITAELISRLSDLKLQKNIMFISMRNGGLIFS